MASTRTDAHGACRLEDMRSGSPVRLYLRGRQVWREAGVTVPAGGGGRVEISARPAGELFFGSEKPCPVAALTVAIDDGEERPKWPLAGRSELVRLTLPPGRARRQVRYLAPLTGGLRFEEGEATVTAQRTVRARRGSPQRADPDDSVSLLFSACHSGSLERTGSNR